MTGFAYRCPNTGLNVQGFTADDPGDDDSYVSVTCIICTRVHLVNPRSGKVVGADNGDGKVNNSLLGVVLRD